LPPAAGPDLPDTQQVRREFASLRKGWFRMIGTIIGAVAIVVLTACFPQDRGPFLVGLALWGAGCALVATLLRNFAAYAAALAGNLGL
jgi:uncharacterized membrane protein YccC